MPTVGMLATLAGIAALCGTGPLDILLTNDDGAEAAGIRALRAQLTAAGHRVTLVAPDHNASGTAISAVTTARNRVFQSRGPTRLATSLARFTPDAARPENEVPRSPVSSEPTQFK